MTTLNLPPYDVRLGGTRSQPTIFDTLRRRYVSLTPEEWVRQHFVHFLIDEKGYPPTLLANEVSLKIGEKSLRADTVLYDTDLRPRMIVEYKAPTVALTQKVFEQVATYNLLLHVTRKKDSKKVWIALQSIPFGPNRTNVGFYYHELLADHEGAALFAYNWKKGLQVSTQSSAYSTFTLQKDGKLGFLWEEGPTGYNIDYRPISIEEITLNEYR